MRRSEQEALAGFSDQTVSSVDVLARALHVKNAELQPTLEGIVSTAVATLGPAWHAGLITLSRGRLVPQATTGRPPQVLDQLQQTLGDGPCIVAAQQQTVISIDQVPDDRRWPDFSVEAEKLGVCSMLCVPLWVHERCLGTLSLYADHASAFNSHHERVTRLFATLAALALAEAQRTDEMQTALASRDVIGQAKGILMERHRVAADTAFRQLSQVSQDSNIKLTAVARHLVETGELPRAAQKG